MLVNRRTALKQALVVSAGLALLPACLRKTAPASITLKNIAVDSEGESMLALLADTLIPTTSTPGAKDVKAHLFALTMVDDCFKKEDQQQWTAGMKAFSELSEKKTGKSFEKSTPEARAALLGELEKAKAEDGGAAYFYHATKRLIIQGYTTSEYFLTKVQVYELVPARFHGSIPVKPASRRTA
ncbi:gluconate 2-dehydrogenase subunit 3 family protein [Chitinophaga rhizophila]|uniref:Gluconate 2-dehydrogenase subunit 3 family protein n=1 Tax=Chitinophaga rhizophila TaxID=2866212 RepID=A0ABS7G586_9BACT|nr:gluconate 2-dehydrogenase subunit 3 family protein [Chitinophaga rhizophila]MBW8682794.1 gluconate 2-dehydrogenase subunit 3 family protein [Chitinophaga rhizophila]